MAVERAHARAARSRAPAEPARGRLPRPDARRAPGGRRRGRRPRRVRRRARAAPPPADGPVRDCRPSARLTPSTSRRSADGDSTPTSTRSRPPSGSRPWRPSSATTAPSARGSCSRRSSPTRACAACTRPRTSARPTSTRSRPRPRRRSRATPRSSTECARSMRWNAIATVLQANKESSELGGHIASFQSAATLYEVGFNHFWHAPSESHGGDLVFIQGHSSPGIYARAFLEGRLTEEQLTRFRTETEPRRPGSSSYPHPWLMPDFWQFPTVSMGLGPLMAIYQARFMKYLQRPRHRRHRPAARCGRSWATARWTSPSRWARSRSPAASTSTTSSSSSTATCSASTARCAATARSSRSWRRTSAAPAGTSSR